MLNDSARRRHPVASYQLSVLIGSPARLRGPGAERAIHWELNWELGTDVFGMCLAVFSTMTMRNRLTRWGGARLSRRMSRAIPILGVAIAAATVVATMRRKGLIGGALDTGLNALPGIGAAKNVIEIARGRDFFPDRPRPATGRRAG